MRRTPFSSRRAREGEADGDRASAARASASWAWVRPMLGDTLMLASGWAGSTRAAECDWSRSIEPRQPAAAAGDEDAAERRGVGLGQVEVERAADLLDQRAEAVG